MGSIVLRSLSVLLGVFFVFVGTIKVTSQLSKDLHKDLVSFHINTFLVMIIVFGCVSAVFYSPRFRTRTRDRP